MKYLFISILIMVLFSTISRGQNKLTFTIEQPPPLQINTEQNVTLIMGEEVEIGSPSVANGGYGDYTYQWTPTKGLSDHTLPNPVAFPDQTTTYSLTVTDSCNCEASIEVTVTIDQVSGVEPDKAKGLIKVYPNPGTQFISLDLSALMDYTDVNVKIYNSQGKIVKEAILSEKKMMQLDVTGLASGAYMLHIQTSRIESSYRIIIQ